MAHERSFPHLSKRDMILGKVVNEEVAGLVRDAAKQKSPEVVVDLHKRSHNSEIRQAIKKYIPDESGRKTA